jgi:regulator of nucleoside diphosphate kinase
MDKRTMERRAIYITEPDMKRLQDLLASATADRDKAYLSELEQELSRCMVVPQKSIPNDVITMNSRVRLRDMDTGKDVIYTLVFPANADAARNKISVLAPIGTALLGYRVDDIITWEVPSGLKKLKVEEVIYQPEAAGDYEK